MLKYLTKAFLGDVLYACEGPSPINLQIARSFGLSQVEDTVRSKVSRHSAGEWVQRESGA